MFDRLVELHIMKAFEFNELKKSISSLSPKQKGDCSGQPKQDTFI